MTGVSHAITGAAVALVIKEPVIALPAAFLSHFVCDMVPHIGTNGVPKTTSQIKKSTIIHLLDLLLIIVFFGFLAVMQAPLVVFAGAVLAGSPDLVWLYRFIVRKQIFKRGIGSYTSFDRWHMKIQWSETLKYGLPVELAYSSILLYFIFDQL